MKSSDDAQRLPAGEAAPGRRLGLGPRPLGLLVWALTWGLLLALDIWFDAWLDLANLALLLVLGSALASLWLPGGLSAAASALSVVAFNWTFVPPRHSFRVDLHQHALLLVAMLLVNWVISSLVIRQRLLAEQARTGVQREQRLRQWGQTLRDAEDPRAHAAILAELLTQAAAVPVALRIGELADATGAEPPADADLLLVGEASDDQRAGLALCHRDGRAFGPGTGRYQEQPDLYLPLRGRSAGFGAAVLQGAAEREIDEDLRGHLQALCDQMGQALQRHAVACDERLAREQAQLQSVRNAMLAAISHDYRTPLATILGAASSLAEQAERMDALQRRRLALGIAEEAQRLSRLTDNTLQLARLDAPGVSLRCDWESAEEIVGAVLRRARRRPDGQRVRARLEPGLPLLWCDATLVSQLLENLVDNALKYSHEPVELLARRIDGRVVLSVRDRGPGIAPAWRQRVFEVFQRGDPADLSTEAEDAGARRRGAGVGLAVCRAIARAHGGELRLRARGHGGSAFEFQLPLREQPLAAGSPDEALAAGRADPAGAEQPPR